jgi:transcriptional regulator of acetoin/glycerol metabolism
VVERAVNLVGGNIIEPEHFGSLTQQKKKNASTERREPLLGEVERQTIFEVTEAMGFNISKASKKLGISRATLYKKLKKHNLSINRKDVNI